MAAIESGDGKSVSGLVTKFAQPFRTDMFVQHPQEMADLGAPAVMQIFLRQPGVDRPASSASLTKAAWASSRLSVQVLQIVIRGNPRVPPAQGFVRSMCKIRPNR